MKVLNVAELVPPHGEYAVEIPLKPFLFFKPKNKVIDISWIPSEAMIRILQKVTEFSMLEVNESENTEESQRVLFDLAEIVRIIFEKDFPTVTVEWIMKNLSQDQQIAVINYAMAAFKELAGKNALAAKELAKAINHLKS